MRTPKPSSFPWLLVGLALLVMGGRPRPRAGKRLTYDELFKLARDAGWDEDDAAHAAQLAMRESGGDPRAVNDTRGKVHPAGVTDELSVGLWQINTLSSPQWSVEWLKAPKHNASAAYDLFRKNGSKPWRLPNTS
jgi:hypothetical protein